jgi:hypothetical protein
MTHRFDIRPNAIANRWDVFDRENGETVRICGTPQAGLEMHRAHDVVDQLNLGLVTADEDGTVSG